jgi:hypothetical protein
LSLALHEGGRVWDIGAKLGGFLEETGGWEMVGREALAEEGGAKGAVLSGVLFHQGFEGSREVSYSEPKLSREVAVGNGLTRGREGREPAFKPGHSESGP